ncbi:MAG: hypothetical protein EA424_21860, partial [Planctomycetaceae bacterium]
MNQDPSLPLTAALRVEDLCTDFEEQYRAGQSPRIEDFLVQIEDSTRRHLLRELLLLEVELRRRAGQTPRADDYRPRFPEHADLVEEALDETINKSAADQSSELPDPPRKHHLTATESCGKFAPASAAYRLVAARSDLHQQIRDWLLTLRHQHAKNRQDLQKLNDLAAQPDHCLEPPQCASDMNPV